MNMPINFRAFLIVALSVILSVFCVYAYMLDRVVGIAIGCVVLCVICAALVIVIFLFLRKRLKLRVVLAFALALLSSVSAFSVGCSEVDDWAISNELAGSRAVVGRVCAIDIRSGMYRVNLDELTLGGRNADGLMRLDFAIAVAACAENISLGDRIAFGANVKSKRLCDGYTVNGDVYRSNIRYSATLTDDNISIVRGKPKPLESFLSTLHELYLDNMGEKYGNIAFSMITGDKNALDGDISDNFSAVGLGHIMAVSGLHIGFLTIVLNLILRRVNRKLRLPFIWIFLIAYAVISDFSPSVVRAVIMAFASGASLLVGGRRDLLSSLLCAFSAILAVKPLYMFEAGFLLSFGAISGIAMFANMIARGLKRFGVTPKVSSALSSSVSVAVGILPAEIYFFGQIQTLAVIVNMFILPYISVVFISIFAITPIAAIPGCAAALVVCKYLLIPLDYVSAGLARMPHIVIYLKSRALVMACWPVMFMASDFIMLGKSKTPSVIYAAIACLAIIAVCAL